MSDLIERQAAIDEIEERKNANGYRSVAVISELNRLEGYIMRLPSAQPESCEDTISRQAVYNVLDKMPVRGFKKDRETIHGLISLSQVNSAIIDLPSAQPEIIRCKDCIHRDPEDKKCDSGHFIQWQLPRDDNWFCADAERKPMSDLISRQAAIDVAKQHWYKPDIAKALEELLSAQPEIIRCKDCKYSDTDNTLGVMFCWRVSYHEASEDGFCKWAERRTDE